MDVRGRRNGSQILCTKFWGFEGAATNKQIETHCFRVGFSDFKTKRGRGEGHDPCQKFAVLNCKTVRRPFPVCCLRSLEISSNGNSFTSWVTIYPVTSSLQLLINIITCSFDILPKNFHKLIH